MEQGRQEPTAVSKQISFRLQGWQSDTHEKDTLQGRRDTPSPLIVSFVVAIGCSSDNDTTNRSTHLQSRCASSSENERNKLTGIGW